MSTWLHTWWFDGKTDCLVFDAWYTSFSLVACVAVRLCLSSYLAVLIIRCTYSTSFALLLAIRKLSCFSVAIFYTSRNFRTARCASVSLCSWCLLFSAFLSFSCWLVTWIDSSLLSLLFFYVWEWVAESCYSVNMDKSRPFAHNIHRMRTGRKSKSAYHGTQLSMGNTRRSRKLSSKSVFSRWKISRYGANDGGSTKSKPLPAGSANSLYCAHLSHYTFPDIVTNLSALLVFFASCLSNNPVKLDAAELVSCFALAELMLSLIFVEFTLPSSLLLTDGRGAGSLITILWSSKCELATEVLLLLLMVRASRARKSVVKFWSLISLTLTNPCVQVTLHICEVNGFSIMYGVIIFTAWFLLLW